MILRRFITLVVLLRTTVCQQHHLSKRALLFTRYTVVQFSTGLSVPLVLPRRSINFSIVGQVNYNLPYNVTNFQPMIVKAREKDKYTSTYFDISRKKFYKYIIAFLDSFGLNGEQCLLRAICEIAEYPMHIKDEDTLLEKIVHFIFTPSLEAMEDTYREGSKKKLYYKLLLAERTGIEGKVCANEYPDCISLVDIFANKYFI
ncbi:unnamed protein product [Acanthoscelides obtectus]|uniref:Uncharacterized protein n=1 Tax=Acanthoscelides obtectus TaxID=200917 RepID=A0A9P0JZM8_ACAOB|nr:unnamed protein product [Acanthoscelides obtectus]CAK1663444.1 hypothetical protein AOBTE_LOCUS23665 [Acanthoscelides obtectus]